MNNESISMLKGRLEIANQRVKDLETQIIRNAINPNIYSIYADCRWGIGLSRKNWSGAQAAVREVMKLFEEAQENEVPGFAQLDDLRNNSMDKGIIELHHDDNGEVRSDEDAANAKHALGEHIKTLVKMSDALGGINFANLRLVIVTARQGLESALALLEKAA
jgi:hypothetical protein